MSVRSFLGGKVILHSGDCREVLASLPEASVDSIVTDPPYGIGFMGKKWDTPGALVERKAATENTWDHVGGNHNPSNSADQVRTRLSEGRKYQAWCEEWARAALRVLKPGGHIVAFSGTRTYHRMVTAIEDAGFEVRDQIGWTFAAGFPKSHNLDGEHEGWGTALKPAWEPVCLARKPLIGTVAQNVTTHGCGALNIDGCRIEGAPAATRFDPSKHSHDGYRMTATGAECYARSRGRAGEASAEKRYTDDGASNFAAMPGPRGGDAKGRWPANICHDGSPEVMACFPETPGQLRPVTGVERSMRTLNAYGDFGSTRDGFDPRGDSGSAARFFFTAKADASDRVASKHPTVKPLDLMQWLCRLVTPKGGTVLDPFAGTGTTGEAAWREGFRAILIEREAEYQADIARRMDLAEKPSKRAAVAKTKGKIDDHGPLFSGGDPAP